MAVTASGLVIPTWMDALDTTQLALDLDLETHKIALFDNTITPNFDTDTAYGVGTYASNEVTGPGWSAGGVAITGTGLAISAGNLTWDATDVAETGVTVVDARAGLIYADALAGNNAICLVDFGADYSATAGPFDITWGSGIIVFDMTPA